MKYNRICNNCGKPYVGQGKYCCSVECRNQYLKNKKLNISDSERKRRSESMREKTKNKKLSNNHKVKIGNASKLRWSNNEFCEKMHNSRLGHIVTEETKKKISNAQKGRKCPWVSKYNKNRIPPKGWHHTEESKRKISNGVSGEKNGQYGKLPPKVNKIKYIDINGRIFNFRSKWELKLAEYFDKNNITWDYEKTTYSLSNGLTYTPDFFTNNCIYEVKGYYFKKSIEKFECFIKDNPTIKIILADRKYLTKILKLKL